MGNDLPIRSIDRGGLGFRFYENVPVNGTEPPFESVMVPVNCSPVEAAVNPTCVNSRYIVLPAVAAMLPVPVQLVSVIGLLLPP